jgi:hypothetical protein
LSRPSWALDAGIGAFAVTFGALLAFAWRAGSAFAPFAAVGERVARPAVLSSPLNVALGVAVHLGESLLLGVVMAAVLSATSGRARLRAATTVTIAWVIAARWNALAVVRVDVAAQLSLPQYALVMTLLAIALALAPRRN